MFIHLLLHISLPLSKNSLEINTQQYKAKLFNETGEVEFRVLCVPAQFAKTLVYREALLKLIFETVYMYFLKQLKMQTVTLPEVSNGFVI